MFFLIIVSAMPTLADGGGTVTNSVTIVGEAGNDGIGGDGGTGIEFNGSGITFINTGAVTGGSGGSTSGLGGPGVSFTGAGASFLNSGVVSGGAGGFPSFGGNGGGGGPGVSFTGPGASFLNSGAVSGGAGGDLPSLGANGGGPGASFSGSGATFINSGTVTGGVGYGGLVNIPHGSDGGVGGAGVASSAKGATLTNSGTVSGGAGGLGITGGGGGAGMSFTESGATLSNSGMVSGGAGGSGGFGLGGGGGTGASFTGSGATFTNSGTVNGGGGGSGFRSGGATGGAGIVGTGLTVINSGAVSGGLSASGLRANAITFTGGTNILELQAGSTITGNVVAFSAADTLRLGGTSDASIDVTQIGAQYQGFGLFQKTGSSTWMLTGANATAMPWTLSGGTLQVNANMASSAMTVSAGGILGGIGTVGSVNVNGGGTLAPGQGAGLGTMTIAGNLTFQPGAVYVVQVHPSAMSMADVAAGGTATLAGTIEATFPAGGVPRSDTILHAAGFGGTRFDGLQISDLPTGFGASLDYTTTDVILALTATLGTGQLSGNQQQVSAALNDFFNAGGVLTPNFVSLFGLTGRDLNTALTQLSGEAATGAQQGAFQLMTEFLTLMLDPFVDGRTGIVVGFAPDSVTSFQLSSEDPASIAKSAPVAQGWTLWGSAYGGANHTNGDHAVVGSNDLTASTGGFAAGADYRLSPSTALGFALAGGGTGWNLANGLGGGHSTAFQAGVYGKTTFGPAYVAVSLAYTQHWVSTDRLSFGFEQLTANFNAESFGGRVEGGYRFTSPIVAVTPYVALQPQAFVTPSYSESDASGGSFGLSYAGRTATDTRSELGGRFDHTVALDPTTLLVLRAKLAWAHDWVSDPSLDAVFQALPGASFVVRGATPPSNLGLVSAGAELRIANGLAFAARFDGEFASSAHTLSGTAIVRYTW
jgi:uncharacterized protein with beta-barrel porin domain